MKAVYKSSLSALFAIGIKSPKYFDAFTAAFSEALDKEFDTLGIHKKTPEQETSVSDSSHSGTSEKKRQIPASVLPAHTGRKEKYE